MVKFIEFTRHILYRTLHNLSLIEVSVLIFLCYFNLRLLYAPDSQDALIARSVFQGTFVFYCVTLLMSRGEALRSERARGVIHRSSLLLSVLGLYIAAMRRTLPTDGIAFWKESGVAFSFFVCVNSEVF